MAKWSVEDRAVALCQKAAPAVARSGGHNQLFSVTLALTRGLQLSAEVAFSILRDHYSPRCAPPWSDKELQHKVRTSLNHPLKADQAEGWMLDDADRGSAPKGLCAKTAAGWDAASGDGGGVAEKPVFVPESLEKVSSDRLDKMNRAWLGDRSPVAVHDVGAEDFLRELYSPGESVAVVAGNYQSMGSYIAEVSEVGAGERELDLVKCVNRWDAQSESWELSRGARMKRFRARHWAEGAWFLANPVTGQVEMNDGTPSWRSGANVTDWRWLVLESDVRGWERAWVTVLTELPVPIGAIYSSGGASIHALIRVDAESKEHWDELVAEDKRVLVELGADPNAMSAVRLTRLPQVYRGRSLQALHYFNPGIEAGDDRPIVDLDRQRDVADLFDDGPEKLREFYKL